jgi:hypothetical protein
MDFVICPVTYNRLFLNEWPTHMQVWLHSVYYNPSITFTLLTNLNTSHSSWRDNLDDIPVPANLKLVSTNLETIVSTAAKELDFGFRLKVTKPYKLCDYNPLIGVLFADLLQGYTHW